MSTLGPGATNLITAVADATGLPVLIYDIPGRTGVNMTAATQIRISQIANIARQASRNAAASTSLATPAMSSRVRREAPTEEPHPNDLGAALLEGPHAACGMTSWA